MTKGFQLWYFYYGYWHVEEKANGVNLLAAESYEKYFKERGYPTHIVNLDTHKARLNMGGSREYQQEHGLIIEEL